MQPTDSSFYVVGIGLSAGGITSLQEFLSHLPSPTGASFVIIAHLPSDQPSHLDRVLSPHSQLKVEWVLQGAVPEAEHAYLLPPGQQLSIQDGVFQLSARNQEEKINHMIDIGFAALADGFGRRTIGIILSGTGQDGLEGVKAIEHYAGLVMVQHPQTAEFKSMPYSVIAKDHPDLVGTPSELAHILMSVIASNHTR